MTIRYFVLTTPTCTRCRVLKKLVTEWEITHLVEFVAAGSDEGKLLSAMHLVRGAGFVIDKQTSKVVELSEAANKVRLN